MSRGSGGPRTVSAQQQGRNPKEPRKGKLSIKNYALKYSTMNLCTGQKNRLTDTENKLVAAEGVGWGGGAGWMGSSGLVDATNPDTGVSG